MVENCLLYQLKRLKTSSKESVENLESFSNFKKYMHVKRNIQDELLGLILNSNNSRTPKLILVCGSVGDGKSHIISYMKESKYDLMKNFKLHNDATESFNPHGLCIDTLNEELNDFADENLFGGHCKKMILAINLGTLSNFIDSEYGSRYTKLKDFVKKKKILEVNIEDSFYQENEIFQYINFSDYHMYSLTENGPKSDYMRYMMKKVVEESEGSPFFTAYVNGCKNCSYENKCPIKYNYEFLGKEEVQDKVVELLIKNIIKNKVIISTRALLDFIYSILVDVRFDNISNRKFKNILNNLTDKDYIDCMLPSIIFTENNTVNIINTIAKLDPLNIRSERMDELIVALNNTRNLLNLFTNEIDIKDDLMLKEILYDNKDSINKEMKKSLIEYFFRLYMFNGNKVIEEDKLYDEFCSSLYYLNVGNKKYIKDLNKDIIRSMYLWNGHADREQINIDLGKKQSKYKISQKLIVTPSKKEYEGRAEKDIHKFINEFVLKFQDKISGSNGKVSIDYKLYELLFKVRNGYRPNKKDRTDYINFTEFINKIANTENREDEVIFTCNIGKNKKKFILELDYDGEFRFMER